MTSTNESCRELFKEETKKSLTTVSCDKVLVEDEYVLDAESLKMITVPEFCVFKTNAGILKSSCLSSMRVHDIRELEFGIKPMPITHRGPNDAKNEPKTVTIAGIVDKTADGTNDEMAYEIAGKVPVALAPIIKPVLSVVAALTVFA